MKLIFAVLFIYHFIKIMSIYDVIFNFKCVKSLQKRFEILVKHLPRIFNSNYSRDLSFFNTLAATI